MRDGWLDKLTVTAISVATLVVLTTTLAELVA